MPDPTLSTSNLNGGEAEVPVTVEAAVHMVSEDGRAIPREAGGITCSPPSSGGVASAIGSEGGGGGSSAVDSVVAAEESKKKFGGGEKGNSGPSRRVGKQLEAPDVVVALEGADEMMDEARLSSSHEDAEES